MIILLLIFLITSISYKVYLTVIEKDFNDHNFQSIKTLESLKPYPSYSFAVVSSIKNSDDIFKKKMINDLNNEKELQFLISTGNSVLDGAEEKYRLLNKALNNLNIPSFIGIGKNEISDNGYQRYYNHYGQSYFSFIFNNDYFIFIDTTKTTSFDFMTSWSEEELIKASKYKNIIVIMDESPLDKQNSKDKSFYDNLNNLFDEYNVTSVFYSGIDYNYHEVNGVNYYSSGMAGGISNDNNYGYVKVDINQKSINTSYVKINAKYNVPIIRIWVGLWYGIHTLFYVQFINMIIILSIFILLCIIIYTKISKETDYYRDFSNVNNNRLKNKKLKIAMFTNNYFPFIGGVPISISRIASSLKKNNHEVIIFAPKYPNYSDTDKNIVRCSLLKYSTSGKFPFAIANIYAPSIKRKFNNYSFDLVHVHHPFWMGKKGLKLAKKNNIPVVLTYHTRLEKYSENLPFGKLFFKNVMSHKMIKSFAQKCDGIIAPTKSAKEYLENIGVSRPKLIMPTGIDITQYEKIDKKEVENIRKTYIKNNDLLFCSVFRLSPEKNGIFLIEGLKKVKEKSKKSFKCLIIGDGPEKESLQTKINSLNMQDNIILCGRVDPNKIYSYYLASDLFVFASQSETQGMVLLEAMAGNCPVISIRSSGTDDVIINNFNGYKTQSDINEWSNRIIQLIEDENLLNKMKVNAKEFSSKYFVDNLSIELEAFYKSLIVHKKDFSK